MWSKEGQLDVTSVLWIRLSLYMPAELTKSFAEESISDKTTVFRETSLAGHRVEVAAIRYPDPSATTCQANRWVVHPHVNMSETYYFVAVQFLPSLHV